MKDLKEIVKDIERDLVVNIVLSMRHKRISLAQAKEIASGFMKGSPFKDYADLFDRLYELSNKHREARRVYVKYSPIYEKEKTERIIKEMRNYMKNKDYSNAVRIAKGARYG